MTDPRFQNTPEVHTAIPPRWQRFLFWLAGARWELLKHCPPSEQERVAVQGSTVLVPTVMAFLGMYFFAKSRFQNPPFFPVFAVSFLWAFVILTTDRILISMYRPFLSEKREPGTVTFSLFRSQFFANSEAKQSKTYPLCTTSTRRSYICSGLITKS